VGPFLRLSRRCGSESKRQSHITLLFTTSTGNAGWRKSPCPVCRAGAGTTGPAWTEAPAVSRKGPDQRLPRPKGTAPALDPSVIIVPKYRKKVIFGTLRKGIGKILRELCEQEGVELVEGHAMGDHVHLCLSIPPKFSVANTVGFIKGKSAIRIHREYLGRQRNFTGFHFWSRGYCVSTVGLDEEKIRAYIRAQEEEEKREEQLNLGGLQPPSSRR